MPSEQDLLSEAQRFLKEHYGEDTVSMDTTDNSVDESGNGVLSVDCTVSVHGRQSDWHKKFTFRDGNAISMDWRRR